MHKIMLSTAIALSLAGGAPALAKAHHVEKASATASKSAECARQWRAETSHTQTRKAFMAACTRA